DVTRQQAAGLERALNSGRPGPRPFRTYLGMKHSPPFIAEGVREMERDGVARAVGLVLAPHWATMSVESYIGRVDKAIADVGGGAGGGRGGARGRARDDRVAERGPHARSLVGSTGGGRDSRSRRCGTAGGGRVLGRVRGRPPRGPL